MYQQFIEKFQHLLANSKEFYWKHLKSNRSFSRCDKLDLSTVIVLIISQLSRSLQIELADYFYHKNNLLGTASKSALCQARKKIEWELFKELNQDILAILSRLGLYGHQREGKFAKVAIDGFKVRLPQKKELAKKFGSVRNQHARSIVMASAVLAYDLETGYALEGELDHVDISEKALAFRWFDKDVFHQNTLLIYDRFYIGYAFAYQHKIKGFHFIMRLRKNWNNATKEFIKSGEEEREVTITIPEKALTALRKQDDKLTGKHSMTLRLVKGLDDNGEPVYYATDVLDKQALSKEQIHQDYARRWEAETAIDALKNKLQLECFSGHSELTVRQDFYACLSIFNISKVIHNNAMEQLLEQENEKLEQTNKQDDIVLLDRKSLKRKVNHNLIIGMMSFLLRDILNPKKDGAKIYRDLIALLLRFPEPVRKGRRFKIKYRTNRKKGRHFYHSNYKKAS